MCARYGQIAKDVLEFINGRQLDVDVSTIAASSNTYLRPSDSTLAISYSSANPIELISGEFIFRPTYNPERGWVNARAEGKSDDNEKLNISDDPDYEGPYKIGINSGSASAIQFNRCVIPVSYFLEGPKKEALSIPYVIRRKDKKPFGIAGFYSNINSLRHIGIVTTPAAPLLYEKVGHHRSPFVLTEDEEHMWLNPEIKNGEEIGELFHPFDSKEFEALKLFTEPLKKGTIDSRLERLMHDSQGNFGMPEGQGQLF